VRGMRAWTGFRNIGIEYERGTRAAGETKYPFRKLIALAMDGLFSFSTFPLRLATWLGVFTVLVCAVCSVFVLVWRIGQFRFMGHVAAELPGWTAIAFGLMFFSGVQLLILGIMGEYLGRIYTEVKGRPRWIIRKTLGLPVTGERVRQHDHDVV
jgi:polyisoprenyl-phosphate glycosyltransferase